MKYAVKVARDTEGRRGFVVYPPVPVPDSTESYRVDYAHNYSKEGYRDATGLLVFETEAAAKRAYDLEVETCRIANLPPAERRLILLNKVTRLKDELGINRATLARFAGCSYETIFSAVNGREGLSPRMLARLKLAADAILDLAERLPGELPDPGLCGIPRKGHYVQPAIYTHSAAWRKRRSADNAPADETLAKPTPNP